MKPDEQMETLGVGAPSAEDFLTNARDEMRERASSREAESGERAMGRCTAAFNALYGAAIEQRVAEGLPPLSETMGWEFMSVLKKARGATGAYRADDYTDDVAYAALAAECASQASDADAEPGLRVPEPPPPADMGGAHL